MNYMVISFSVSDTIYKRCVSVDMPGITAELYLSARNRSSEVFSDIDAEVLSCVTIVVINLQTGFPVFEVKVDTGRINRDAQDDADELDSIMTNLAESKRQGDDAFNRISGCIIHQFMGENKIKAGNLRALMESQSLIQRLTAKKTNEIQ